MPEDLVPHRTARRSECGIRQFHLSAVSWAAEDSGSRLSLPTQETNAAAGDNRGHGAGLDVSDDSARGRQRPHDV